MSQFDMIQSNINRKNSELAKLRSDRANEVKKLSSFSGKILSARQAISRTKTLSTIQSKNREIETAQKNYNLTEAKVADFDSKIAKKEKEIVDEQKKLSQEGERIRKKNAQAEQKRLQEEKKRITNEQSQQKKLSDTVNLHSRLHAQTQKTLDLLNNAPDRITVLFMASNPVDQPQLHLDQEARDIGDMIRKSDHRDSVDFVTRWATRTTDILQAINETKPTIIHFSGHGSSNDEIVFQDDRGNTKLISKDVIVQVMIASVDSIKLVFFNTCCSHGQAQAVVEHVDAAIGMTTAIGDEAAKVFAAQFYSAIGFGLSIRKAFEQAKVSLMLEGIPEESTPALYIRDGFDADDMIIVKPPEGKFPFQR